MQARPILYIDVDGVLFGLYDDWVQLRPGAMTFLRRCAQHFDCRWLTCWGESRIRDLLHSVYAPGEVRNIRYQAWGTDHVRRLELGKVSGVDLASDFYWIEDALLAEELALLEQAGRRDRYIEVDYQGADELARVWTRLQQILQERDYEWKAADEEAPAGQAGQVEGGR